MNQLFLPRATAPAAPAVCHCHAYPFPHRAGGGKCEGPAPYVCSDCGQACEGKWADEGYGRTEFWGRVSVHEAWSFESTCCGAPVYANQAGLPYADPPPMRKPRHHYHYHRSEE